MEMLQRNQQWVWNTQNQPEMAMKELKLNSKWPSPCTYREEMQFNTFTAHSIWMHWNNVMAV